MSPVINWGIKIIPQDAAEPNRVKLTALEVLFVNWISFPFITSPSVGKLPSRHGKLKSRYLKSSFKPPPHATILIFPLFFKNVGKVRQKSSSYKYKYI